MLKARFHSAVLFGFLLILSACGGSQSAGASGSGEGASGSNVNLESVSRLNATLWSATSAEATLIYLQTWDLAKSRLRTNLEMVRPGRMPAVVVDIDETVLDNSPHYAERTGSGEMISSGSWEEWVLQANAEALPGALSFAQTCEDMGVQVFYISNRDQEHMMATMRNLSNLGFPFVDEDHVMLMEGGESDKSYRRTRAQSMCDVILYCGDNLRDFREDFANRQGEYGRPMVYAMSEELLSRFVLFPNPMYGSWLSNFTDEEANPTEAVQRVLRESADQ